MKNDNKFEKPLEAKEKKELKVKQDQQKLDPQKLDKVSGGSAWEIFKR